MLKTFSQLALVVLVSSFINPLQAEWLCSVMDDHGHRWEFPGMTQDRATTISMRFCRTYSRVGHTCHTTACVASKD